MNRFDDKLSWRVARMLIAPAISAFMVYVAFRVQLENRLTTVEVRSLTTDERLSRMESKIDRLLERRERDR